MGQSMNTPAGSPEDEKNQQSPDQESYEYDVMTVEEITASKLGKLIIKYCGNEGTIDDERTGSLRMLLQRAITNLEPQQEQYPGVWKDAELKIYDLYGNGYVVKSGEGSVKFVALITGNGDVELDKIKDESWRNSMKALFRRKKTPKLQIEGAPPDQSNASKGWLSSLFSSLSLSGSQSKESQVEGLSPSKNKDEQRPSELPSQMDAGSASEDGEGAPHGQHQDQSLTGREQGDGSQNNASCSSSSFNPIDFQPVNNQPDSESNDESGSATQVQMQPTRGIQTDHKEEE